MPDYLSDYRNRGPIKRLIGDHVTVVDVEFGAYRALEVGLVRLFRGAVVDVDHFLVDPGPQYRPFGITARLTGITNEVIGAGAFADHARRIGRFVDGTEVFVGYFTGNDRAVLHDEFRRAGLGHGEMKWLDVKDLFARVHEVPAPKLEDACAHYGLPVRTWHRAGEDARATAQLLGCLCRDLENRGGQREDVPLAGGWLGTEWYDDGLELAPVRRRDPQPVRPERSRYQRQYERSRGQIAPPARRERP